MRLCTYFLAALVATMSMGMPYEAQAKTIEAGNALVSWYGTGEATVLGEGQTLFTEVVKGMLFIRHYEGSVRGPIHAAKLYCPTRIILDQKRNAVEITGLCTLTAHEGKDVAYAEWKCSGKLDECQGEFTFTSGTGGWSGISGKAPSSATINISRKEIGEIFGYLDLPKLTYTLP